MRVLYFHQHFTTPAGAGGTRSYELAVRLVERGHEVKMVTGRSDRALGLGAEEGASRSKNRMIDGIEVVNLPLEYSNEMAFVRRSAIFLSYALRSARLALFERYDVAFATSTPLTAGIPGILARWLRRKPFVFEVRDLWPELPRAMGVLTNPLIIAALSALEWLSYHSADRVVGLSPGIKDGIQRRGIPSDRVALIPNACDLDRFGPHVKPWRPDDIPPERLLAVFAGAHGLANGLAAVLDAATELKRRGDQDVVFLLVGSGMEKAELMERAARERLNNVRFMDPIPKSEIAGLMAGADVGMQVLANVPAFYRGTSPNKFFDYLAAGLPVLNNYPGWLAELIDEWKCGFTLPSDDPVAFADALQRAAADRAGLARMGASARALGESLFDRKQLADSFAKVLEGAARARRK